jgi:photosynthetic reaction center H subunit
MAGHPDFFVSAGRDPRGLPVLAKDDQVVAHVTDMWVDGPEHLVRYLELELEPEYGQGRRLVPIGMARVKEKWVEVSSLRSGHFNGVPRIASDRQITKLEEDKVSAYYAGGVLYS